MAYGLRSILSLSCLLLTVAGLEASLSGCLGESFHTRFQSIIGAVIGQHEQSLYTSMLTQYA